MHPQLAEGGKCEHNSRKWGEMRETREFAEKNAVIFKGKKRHGKNDGELAMIPPPPGSMAPKLRPKGQRAKGPNLEGAITGDHFTGDQGKRSQFFSRSNFPIAHGAQSPMRGGTLGFETFRREFPEIFLSQKKDYLLALHLRMDEKIMTK